MTELNKNDKDIVRLANELGQLMQAKKFDEAWTVAGTLQSKMKGDIQTGFSIDKIMHIKKLVDNYYQINREINAQARRMYVVGQKLVAEVNV